MNCSTLFGLPVLSLAVLCLNTPAHAGLVNVGFDDDLAGWEIFRLSEDTHGSLVPDFPLPDAQSQVIGGGGSVTITNDDTWFEVALGQQFDVAADETGVLEFDYDWQLASIADDAFFPDNVVQGALFSAADFQSLATLFANPFGALTGAGSVAIELATFAGQSLYLDFLVSDFDFATGDSLTISNLRITRPDLGVSAPATVLLLLGLLPVLSRRR